MQPITNFRQLEVWQRAHQLVLKVYRTTGEFPKDERFGLISQMRRAAVSVAANIAEGFKRRGRGDKARFYNYSEASLEEVKYFFILSQDLGYIQDTDEMMESAEVISRMLYRLTQKVMGRD
jgi:four helix bundle protein